MATPELKSASAAASAVAWLLAVLAIFPAVLWAQPQPGNFEVYSLNHARAADVEPVLKQVLSALPEQVEVVVDQRANRLLVRGSAEAQRLARQLTRSVDHGQQATQPATPELKTYSYRGADISRAAAELQAQFPASQGVRVAADERTGQLLVLAPPDVHRQISRQLAGPGTPAGQGMPAAADQPGRVTRTVRAPTGVAAPQASTIELSHLSPEQFQAALARLWGERFTALAKTNDEVDSYLLRLADQPPLELHLNRRTGQVVVRGPAAASAAGLRLIAALDAPPRAGDQSTRVVPLHQASARHVRRALDAVQMDDGAARAMRPAPGLGMMARVFQPRPDDAAQPAEAGEQPFQGQPPAGAQAEQPADAGQLQPGEDADAALVGPVQIEYIEELDIFIVRGNQRDVERVLSVIEDIERLAAETEPVVEVLMLEHVGSVAMADIIRPLYDDVLAPRQGRVSITPLVKPNALLLVGREESVRTVTDLIRRLDQPVGPSGQFRLFRLRHAPAALAASTITQFFAERTGLGPRVVVVADYRTNSLIVQASPRDLVEVARLIRGLDTATSEAVNELRVFKLTNALAEELAPVLQEAINVQAQQARAGFPDGQFQQQPIPAQVPGAPGGPAGQAAQLAKSLMLRFMTIDAEGRRIVNSGILTDVRITADPRANSLVVSAPAESMDLLAALIAQLDEVPAATAQIKVFTIDNGDAATLVELLEDLFGPPAGAAGPGGQFGPQQQIFGEGEGALLPLRFSVDPRTNSIIVSGPAGALEVVEAILLRLNESDIRERRNAVYRLKNSPAEAVAQAINEFLRSERAVEQIGDGLSPFEQIEREVIVVAEIVSNSLIISATPRFYEEIVRLVEQLDARPPMVMIQVLIAEVALNNTDEFGIELGLQDSVLFDRSLLGDLLTTTNSTQTSTPAGIVTDTQQIIQAATLTPGFAFNNQPLGNSGSTQSLSTADTLGGQGLTNFAVGRVNGDLGFGGLVLSASSESISVLIRALKESRRLDVLSRPQIMTLDNQQAYIQVGQRVPRIIGSTQTQFGQQNQIDLYPVGLILGVTPRISPDGLVVMEIDAEKSQLGPEEEGVPIFISTGGEVIRSPKIDTTTAQTTISAMDGQTVVFAGLITKSKSQIHRRVPLLSEIPLLGNLFRFDSVAGRKTELLIIMTPHIVRNEADAERVKRVEAARMSWCLADVQRVHGEGGLRGRGDDWADGETMTVYPDGAPVGAEPAETEYVPVPTPAGPDLVPDSEGYAPQQPGLRPGPPEAPPPPRQPPRQPLPYPLGQQPDNRLRPSQDPTGPAIEPAYYQQ